MQNPVLVKGHWFERDQIETWIRMNQIHPITRELCTLADITEDEKFTELCKEWTVFHGRRRQVLQQVI